MPIKYSDTWETKWYGPERAQLLIKVFNDSPLAETPVWILYETYEHAINGICEHCNEKTGDVQIVHKNTAYTDDFKNYAAFCRRCKHEDDTYWQERWDDLNADILQGINDARRRNYE